jgi:hypothetical protein
MRMNKMPRLVPLQPQDIDWLRAHHNTIPIKDMADRIGCCIDTLKRILVREGIQDFAGEKYQVRRDFHEKTWRRPCMGCGDEHPRPKNWYFCRDCRKDIGYDD